MSQVHISEDQHVQYLGHVIGANGLHATDAKIEAIVNAPKNVTELRSYLGLLNYYGRFIPNSASLIHPLNKFLRHNMTWRWTKSCRDAFKSTKEKIVSPNVLVHANADGLSRLPLNCVSPIAYTSEPSVFNLQQIESLPVTASKYSVVCSAMSQEAGRMTQEHPWLDMRRRRQSLRWKEVVCCGVSG